MDEKYLAIKEVAARLGVTRQVVEKWVKAGKLRAVRAGRAVRIPESAVAEFLQPVAPGGQTADSEGRE